VRVDLGEPDVVARVHDALRAGQVVVLPTDTVYGLAALPTDAAAVDQVFALKGRAADTPLAVLCADLKQALGLAAEPGAVRAAAQRWWPGPLTLVVTRRPGIDLHLGEPPDTIGLRVPDHALVRAVATAVGPIAATSANRHGDPPATTAAEAEAALGDGLGLVVDGGRLEASASTVVDTTGPTWRVLRDGPIPGADVVASR
jgi:tRNA threonylcarbamoyl adenosine modification protein (Sua5/YciO/YrdC/YwlC family)